MSSNWDLGTFKPKWSSMMVAEKIRIPNGWIGREKDIVIQITKNKGDVDECKRYDVVGKVGS